MADQVLDLFLDWSKVRPKGSSSVVGSIPFWGDEPNPFDAMKIGDFYVPGLVRISGKGYEQRLDRKALAGHKGERITQLGRGVAEVDIDIAIWTAEHFAALEDIIELLSKDKHVVQTPVTLNKVQATTDASGNIVISGTKKVKTTRPVTKNGPPPTDVYHPMLELFGVKKLTFIKMSIPEDKDGDGVYHLKLTAIQYVPGSDSVSTAVKTQDFSVSRLATGGTALQNQLAETAKKNAAPSSTETHP